VAVVAVEVLTQLILVAVMADGEVEVAVVEAPLVVADLVVWEVEVVVVAMFLEVADLVAVVGLESLLYIQEMVGMAVVVVE
jgi:hypothetical protein